MLARSLIKHPSQHSFFVVRYAKSSLTPLFCALILFGPISYGSSQLILSSCTHSLAPSFAESIDVSELHEKLWSGQNTSDIGVVLGIEEDIFRALKHQNIHNITRVDLGGRTAAILGGTYLGEVEGSGFRVFIKEVPKYAEQTQNAYAHELAYRLDRLLGFYVSSIQAVREIDGKYYVLSPYYSSFKNINDYFKEDRFSLNEFELEFQRILMSHAYIRTEVFRWIIGDQDFSPPNYLFTYENLTPLSIDTAEAFRSTRTGMFHLQSLSSLKQVPRGLTEDVFNRDKAFFKALKTITASELMPLFKRYPYFQQKYIKAVAQRLQKLQAHIKKFSK